MQIFLAATYAELTKLRTVRSTAWTLILYVLLSMAIAVLFGVFIGGQYADMPAADKVAFDPVATGFSGTRLGVLALVVLGVLVMTTEFSSGTIHGSLAAVPRRGVFYGAKLLAGTLVVLLAGTVTVLASFFTTQALLGDAGVSVGDDEVIRALVGGVLYVVLLFLFSLGLATILRSPALTIGILIPLFFMASAILLSIPQTRTVAQFLPDIAGGFVMEAKSTEGMVLTSWTGMAVLFAWAAVAIVGGYLTIRRHDT